MKEITSLAFGTSGLRGLVIDFTADAVFSYLKAFCEAVLTDNAPIIIGHDRRPSSPAIALACINTLKALNIPFEFVGILPTPAIAFYAQEQGAAALVVTGSHIPFDRNGIKFYSTQGEITKAEEKTMLEVLQKIEVPTPAIKALPVVSESAKQAYVQRTVGAFPHSALQGLRVLFYEHSSAGGDVISDILMALGASVKRIERSESFVAIDTEAVSEEMTQQSRQWAKAYGVDWIISTDGDADRPLIGDETGNWFRGDSVGFLTALYLKADTVVTPVSSNTGLEKSGVFKKTIRTKIGSPYVIEAMQSFFEEGDCVVGYEANGGVLLGTDIHMSTGVLKALPTRDAVLPMLSLMCLAKEKECRASALLDEIPQRFTYSIRMKNVPKEKSNALIQSMMDGAHDFSSVFDGERIAVKRCNTQDGYRVTFETDDIIHLRPSGNAPELRCYTEANTEARAKRLCEKALVMLSDFGIWEGA